MLPAPHAGEGAEDEKADAVGGEKTGRAGGEQMRRHQARRDIGGHEQVVEFEGAAQRDQRHQLFQAGGKGQPVQPRRDLAGNVDCHRLTFQANSPAQLRHDQS